MSAPAPAPAPSVSRRDAMRLSLGAAASLAAAPGARAQAPLTVRFMLDWRFEGPAAPFLLAMENGHFKAEGLEVVIETGNGSRESIPRIASGTIDIALGDVNSLIRFRDENAGLDVRAVMMWYDRAPFAIVGRKSRGVTSDAKSLEGRKLGAPAADASFAQWPVFKAINRIDDSKMRFENIGFPVREPMLASGEVDAIFGFANSSYVNLKWRGVPVEDIVLMNMFDYGLELYGNAILVSPKFMAANPQAVSGFLRALVLGLKDAATSPESGVRAVIERNDVARPDIELERLKLTLEQNMLTPWVRANGVGGIDPQRWARALDQLALTFSFKDRARAGAAFDDSFLPSPAERRI